MTAADDITRLAAIAQSEAELADLRGYRAVDARRTRLNRLAAELRTIAEQQGKADGVMDEMVERQARELLAREYEREGIKFVPNAIRTDPILTLAEARAVRAIVASLAPQPKDAP